MFRVVALGNFLPFKLCKHLTDGIFSRFPRRHNRVGFQFDCFHFNFPFWKKMLMGERNNETDVHDFRRAQKSKKSTMSTAPGGVPSFAAEGNQAAPVPQQMHDNVHIGQPMDAPLNIGEPMVVAAPLNCAVCCFIGVIPIPFIQRGGKYCLYFANCSPLAKLSFCSNCTYTFVDPGCNNEMIFAFCAFCCCLTSEYCVCPWTWCATRSPPRAIDISNAVCCFE